MEGKENIYYALGQLAYAVAKADGAVQGAELEKFRDIVEEGTREHILEFNVSEIIFRILKEEEVDTETAYKWAMESFHKYNFYLTDKIKKDFILIIEEVAMAFDSVTKEEKTIVQRFREDIMTV